MNFKYIRENATPGETIFVSGRDGVERLFVGWRDGYLITFMEGYSTWPEDHTKRFNWKIKPPEPKMEEIKLLGWLMSNGELCSRTDTFEPPKHWRRVPSKDETIEVEVIE